VDATRAGHCSTLFAALNLLIKYATNWQLGGTRRVAQTSPFSVEIVQVLIFLLLLWKSLFVFFFCFCFCFGLVWFSCSLDNHRPGE